MSDREAEIISLPSLNNARALILISTSFPFHQDGSEAAGSFVSDLAFELAKYVKVRVVAPGPERIRQQLGQNLEVFRFNAPDAPLSTLNPFRPDHLLRIFSVLRAGRAATRDAIAAGANGHILALWALPSGHWARSVSREAGVPYSVWTLGSDIWSLGRLPIVRQYLRQILRGATKRYSDGVKLADDTQRIGGRPVAFLPSTRKISSQRKAALRSAPPYRLLFLGRWHTNKGVDLLMNALEHLDNDDWKRIEQVEICGGGPLESLVHQSADRLTLANRPVRVRGFLDKEAAELAILDADFLVIPSRIESIPVVFSDAMKLGCAVIATPVGDLPALLAAEPVGVLATGVSAQDILAAVRVALTLDVGLMSIAMATMAERFSVKAIASTLCDALMQIQTSASTRLPTP